MNISIFAKRAFLNTNPGEEYDFNGTKPTRGYLKRVSSIIRADQIAIATGARLNPKSDFQDDICIYVKPELNQNNDFDFQGKRNYLDVIDELGYADVLNKHPEVGAIALSERDFITLSEHVHNKVVLIPQHHANFNREIRTRNKIETVGIIGNHKAFEYLPKDLKPRLTEMGIELLQFSEFFRREDIVDFYKKIDVQIVWRPYRKKLANSIKIVNAASFGIPTIALDEVYFKEMGNAYIGVTNLDHLILELKRLIGSPLLYNAYSKLCFEKAEKYHIDNIAKLYKNLT